MRRRTGLSRGSIAATVAAALPVMVICIGLVVDMGVMFTARRCVQGACDLAALAGVQELDFDALARGEVKVDEERGISRALEFAHANLEKYEALFTNPRITGVVKNPPEVQYPTLRLDARFTVKVRFLTILPSYKNGIEMQVISEAAVREREEW